jgi:hypothetical protein
MANFYVTNNKFPAVPQLFVVSLHKMVGPSAPELNPNFHPTYAVAEPTWKVLVYTSGYDSEGKTVSPIQADVLGSEETVNDFIEGAVAFLCAQIDWSQQGAYSPETDSRAPIVVEQFPEVGQTGVPISSTVALRVKDFLPAIGIDPSSVQMTVDGFAVTPVVTGNKFDYTFTYKPLAVYE